MTLYKNIGRDSGVRSYQIQSNTISVTFTSGVTYVYNYGSAGKEHIENMKELAQNGRGLNSYINKYVKNRYSKKF